MSRAAPAPRRGTSLLRLLLVRLLQGVVLGVVFFVVSLLVQIYL